MSNASFLDALAQAITSPSVALHEFLLELKIQNKIVHAFFEGKTDESFYGTFIRKVKDEDYKLKTYICGNKDSVYYQFEQLSSRSMGTNILVFFVDKDIDDIIPFHRTTDLKIYVTDFYSVENYIVNCEMLEQVFAEIFKQRSGNNASKLVQEKFIKCTDMFNKFMLTVMSWVLYHRRDIENNKTKINLDCVKLKNIYKINDDLEFELTVDGEDDIISVLDSQTKSSTNIKLWNTHKDSLKNEIGAYQPKHYIRGHNEMEFFIYFIQKLKNALNVAQKKPIKLSTEITESNSIDVLGPRTPIPKSLGDFLHSNIKPQLSLGI